MLLRRALLVACLCAFGCSRQPGVTVTDTGPRADTGEADGSQSSEDSGPPDLGRPDSGPRPDGSFLDPDAACASTMATATVERLPVDIIWVVDNSGSMSPVVQRVRDGLGGFSTFIENAGIDYRVIMLSKRCASPTNCSYTSGCGSSECFAVCVPPPLGGDNCADRDGKFYQSSMDIRSTQPLAQVLGTLAQTDGYTVATSDGRGGPPWRQWLRDGASKSFVFVSDDNPSLSVANFENFAGGPNPQSTSRTLGPGILHPSYNGLFDGYRVFGFYVTPMSGCMGNPGSAYDELIMPRGDGRRAAGAGSPLCASQAVWTAFFTQIATQVVRSSQISAEIPVPADPSGMQLNPNKVNVIVRGTGGSRTLGRVMNAAMCSTGMTSYGWYYDNNTTPTKVVLCPNSRDFAQSQLDPMNPAMSGVSVQFGCDSILL